MSDGRIRSLEMSLKGVKEDIDKYPPIDGSTPESMGWEAFIIRYPNYVNYTSGVAFILATEGAVVLEEMGPDLASLGGTIIRRHMYDEEITKIGRG